jgi:prepilin-type N-terminal cleavage/methylation domain-containing protein
MTPVPGRKERGVTLIELLAALAITGFVVAMAGRVFLSGHAQFLRRSADAEKLAAFYRLRAEVRGGLREDVGSCAGGRLMLRDENEPADLGERIRKRMPVVTEAHFLCWEIAAAGGTLQAWTESAQPALVEYRFRIRIRGKEDSLSGSWMR